tara:strand:- start:398 stop:685 length:288 start_codon:yes stop_codon:yes gene_type:complete
MPGFDVMGEPHHDLLGYGTIALSLLPVLSGRQASSACRPEKIAAVSPEWLPPIRLPACLQVFAAAGLYSGMPWTGNGSDPQQRLQQPCAAIDPAL